MTDESDERVELTDDQVEFLNTVFDLVRAGDAATVAGYVDRGVPVDLTNAKGTPCCSSRPTTSTPTWSGRCSSARPTRTG